MTIDIDDLDLTDRQKEAGKLYYGALSGDRRDQWNFAEALAFSDLPLQMQPVLQADFLDGWTEKPGVIDKFTQVEVIDQIGRDVEYDDIIVTNQEQPLESNGEKFVGGLPIYGPEQPLAKLSFVGSKQYLRTNKRGEGLDIEWETIYNSRGAKVDLIPKGFARFTKDAKDTDQIAIARLLVTTAGINTGVLGTTGHVAVSGGVTNPPLTALTAAAVVADAIAQSLLFQIGGVDVDFSDYALVVHPTKVAAIKQGLAALSFTTLPGSAGGLSVTQTIDLGATVEVVGFKWPRAINAAAVNYWFLIPRDGVRKGLVLVKASGEEEPSMWIEATNALMYPGGGEAPVLQGKFTNETWSAKVRYVADGGLIDSSGIIYSTGAGS